MIGGFAYFDNFYPDPERVRSIALGGDHRMMGGAFMGSEYRCPEFPMDLVYERVAALTGLALRCDPGRPAVFRALTAEQEAAKRGHVHVDRIGFACVICLNARYTEDSATSFFRHRETGLRGLHDRVALWRAALRRATSGSALKARLTAEGPLADRWEEVGTVPYRFNRLVVFDSRLFHAAARGFGTDLASAKLTQAFGFWPYRRWRPTRLGLFTTVFIPARISAGGAHQAP